MKPVAITLFVLVLTFGALAQEPKRAPEKKTAPKSETVVLKNAKNEEVGTATVSPHPEGKGVAIKLSLKNLSPGEHAFHVHEKASCEPPDFKSAGAHLNPEGKKHGLKNSEGPHAGDMENIKADDKGAVRATIENERVTLDQVKAGALVVHAKADDMASDPAGNAGDRIACGMVR